MIYLKHTSTEELINHIRGTDPVVECANTLRLHLMETDFNMVDQFYDASDLQEAWANIKLPEVCINFFASLFKFDKRSFDHIESSEEEPCENVKFNFLSESKKLKLLSLFQVMYYICDLFCQ